MWCTRERDEEDRYAAEDDGGEMDDRKVPVKPDRNSEQRTGKVLAYRVAVKRLARLIGELARTGSLTDASLEALEEISRG